VGNYTRADITSSMANLGVARGMTLLMLADLAKFGIPTGFSGYDRVLGAFCGAFRDLVGLEGMLVGPKEKRPRRAVS
jgi:aminoglycoside N3'-acetyltransferase